MSKFRNKVLSCLAFGLVFSGLVFQVNAQSLSGTYQLDTSKSENVSKIVASTAQNNQISATQKEDLEDKLDAPESISITIRGKQVTMSTSISSPVTFQADGRTQAAGSSRVRATMRGNELRVSNVGNGTDYMITFTSLNSGKSMRVTRMVTTSYLNNTVFADSFYNKTGTTVSSNDSYSNSDGYSNDDPKNDSKDDEYSSSDPNDDGYSTSNPDSTNYPTSDRNAPKTTRRTGNFYVPNGTVLTGILENQITTKASQDNDRFTLKVDSPYKYRGAVIEGYLTGIKRSGKISGSSKLTLNFETIRLANGQTYDFAGFLQGVTDAQGKTVKVNDEGQIKGKSRTGKTAKRSGIGAGIGAILGGILGGGKGAIIGATIGGGAGAGSVAVGDKNDVNLEAGSTMSVQSTSPKR